MQTVASLLGLSQPAVSSTIKVLESGCGQTLFERTPRGLQPTRASHEILFPIRRALNELRHIETDITAMRGTLQGVVQVGALPLGPHAHPARSDRAPDGRAPGYPGDHQ